MVNIINRKSICCIISILFLGACTNSNSSSAKQISQKVYDKISAGCGHILDLESIIYYFDADCALCMAEVIKLEEKIREEEGKSLLLIAKTLTPERFAFQAEQQGVQSCILFDVDGFFADEFNLNSKTSLSKNRMLRDYNN